MRGKEKNSSTGKSLRYNEFTLLGGAVVRIKGIQGISLIDFPGKIASTLFTGGCNFRCPFCHNPELIESDSSTDDISYEEIIAKLKERKNFIEGICITGGEPLFSEDIIELIQLLKEETHLPVKIDTNGYNPDILEKIIKMRLADYFAMDIKTSLGKYYLAAGIDINPDRIKKSIDMIINSSVHHEFRTTCVPDIVDSNDIREIGSYIVGAERFALQQFRRDKTYKSEYEDKYPYKPEDIIKFKDILKQFIDIVDVRGI